MAVRTADPIVARSAPELSLVPPSESAPKLPQAIYREVVGVEGSNFETCGELANQRGDFEDVRDHDADHDALLEAVLRVEGLPPLARELIQRAQRADAAEDAAMRRADRRRETAHRHARETGRRLEHLLTGRSR